MAGSESAGSRGMANKSDPSNPKAAAQGGSKTDKSKPGGRRRLSVDGETPAIEMPKKAQHRSLQEILGDPGKDKGEDGPKPEGPVWDPRRLEAFLRGRITLADLEGISKQEQYEMAKIGF